MALLKMLNNKIETAIGAAALDPAYRGELLREQLKYTSRFTPALAICGFVLLLIFVALNANTSQLPQILAWSMGIVLLHGYAFRSWLKSRTRRSKNSNSSEIVRKTCIVAFIFGTCWGMLPIISAHEQASNLHFAAIISVVGVMFGASFALATIPQSVIAMILPCLGGITIAVAQMEQASFTLAILAISAVFLVSIPLFSINHASNMVDQVATKIKIREQNEIISLLLDEYEEYGSDWLWELDTNGKFKHTSQRFLQVSGLSQGQEGTISMVEFLKKSAIPTACLDTLFSHLQNHTPFRDIEIELMIDGENRWWQLAGKPVFDHSRQFKSFIGIGSDITFDKNAKTEISKLALSDPLTGLMNRTKFNSQMESVVSKLERYGSVFSVMFLDLDNFKLINDTRGHQTGDTLLKMVADRILSSVRETDSVARLGGDEFAIILRDNCDAGSSARLAAKLLDAVGRPYEIDGEQHKVGVSIGISLAPQNGTQPTQLLRNADLALYRSKADGRGVFRFFESQMDSDQREKRMLESDLRKAIDQNEFELYFQPLVSPNDGRPTAMEALIRWNHPIRGRISPAEFIPIAEQSSLIQEIGNWTLQEACKIAVDWPKDIIVAVNLSAQHFIGSDIIGYTEQALASSKLPPQRLELEVTESLLINNTDEVFKILASLKKLGVAIALDDFGTGYSSLSYILKFPFDKIKIDRSFVETSGEDESARAILKMIGTLGEALNIRITAEGVETREQVEFLKSIKCDQFQGFYFSRPLPVADIPAFLLKQAHSTQNPGIGTNEDQVA